MGNGVGTMVFLWNAAGRDLHCNHCWWPRSHGSSRVWNDGNEDIFSSKKKPWPWGNPIPSYYLQLHWSHVSCPFLQVLPCREKLPHIPFHRHQHPSGLHQNCRHHDVISGKQHALLKLDKQYNNNIYASLLKRLQYHNWHYIWHLLLTRVTFTLMATLSSLQER